MKGSTFAIIGGLALAGILFVPKLFKKAEANPRIDIPPEVPVDVSSPEYKTLADLINDFSGVVTITGTQTITEDNYKTSLLWGHDESGLIVVTAHVINTKDNSSRNLAWAFSANTTPSYFENLISLYESDIVTLLSGQIPDRYFTNKYSTFYNHSRTYTSSDVAYFLDLAYGQVAAMKVILQSM